MSEVLDLQVDKDHLLSLTKTSPLSGLKEIIWNSLDADASEIQINYDYNDLEIISLISIRDNGHGISYQDALHAFSSLGGSAKKRKRISPGNRILHGEEGKGRFRIFALGSLIKYQSIFLNKENELKTFTITLDENSIKKPVLSDLKDAHTEASTGVFVRIENIKEACTKAVFNAPSIQKLAQMFAVVNQSYRFDIFIENQKIDFTSVIKEIYESDFKVDDNGKEQIEFKSKIIEWDFAQDTSLYLCNKDGVAYTEINLGYKPSIPLTAYLLSDYIEELHSNSELLMSELNDILVAAKELVRERVKTVVREKKHKDSFHIIEKLKKEHLYPYKENPSSPAEEAERQVFDIVTLEVHESLPDFESQESKSKKLTLQLLKEALENQRSDLKLILEEVIELPKQKLKDLAEILDKTSLSSIIDSMKEVQDRLRIIYELRQLLFDKEYSKKVLERKHLHKIVINESWIFGDDYSLGAEDSNLRNVLKAYIHFLGRENLIENIENEEFESLIPDVCLFKQYNTGKVGHFRNLVIELKRPSKTITPDEINQIKKYASKISNDDRFPKEKTHWDFILLSTKLNEDAEFECDQRDREWGHIISQDGLNVYIKKWGDLLNEAESRHQYLKEKLGYEINEEEEGIILLKQKYSEYLPDGIK